MMLTRQCSCLPRHRPSSISRTVISHRATLARPVSRARNQTAVHLEHSASSGCSRSRTICDSAGADVQATADTSKVLYVTRMDPSVRGDDLTAHFKAQAGFESAFVMNVDSDTMGYVQFSTPEAAAAACKELNGSQLRQKTIRVSTQQGGSDADEPSNPSTSTRVSEPASDSTNTSDAQPSSSSSGGGGSSSTGNSSGGSDLTGGAQDVAGEEGPQGMSRSKKYRLRMNARSKADPPPPPSTKILFVPNLKNRTTEEEFVAFVRDQPGFKSASVRLFSGRRPDGYITFDSETSAQLALEALNGSMLNDKPLTPFIHEGYNKERAEAKAADKAEKAAEKAEKQKKSRKQRHAAGAGGSSDAETAGGSSSDTSSGSSVTARGSSDPASGSSSSSSRERLSKQRGWKTYDLRVNNLAWGTTSEALSEHFADCKGFLSAVATLNKEGRASGMGYARFSSAKAAQSAMEAKHESELDGRTISIIIAASNPVQPGGDLLASSSGGKAAWALKIFNLAWETTGDDLVECFKDCQGYINAFTVPGNDNRPSGVGYVLFDAEEAQLGALKAKQNTELGGRVMYLRTVRPGRVESSTAAGASPERSPGRVEDVTTAGAPPAPATSNSEDSAAAGVPPERSNNEGSNIVVLKSLPPQFSYREVIGLCSYFGQVDKVTRMLKRGPNSRAGDREAALEARQGQLCYVHMASVEAAEAVVRALDGHTVQGSKLGAWFGRPAADIREKKGSEQQQKAEGSTAAAE